MFYCSSFWLFHRSLYNFATWWKIGGALKVRSKNLSAQEQKCWGKQRFKNRRKMLRVKANNVGTTMHAAGGAEAAAVQMIQVTASLVE